METKLCLDYPAEVIDRSLNGVSAIFSGDAIHFARRVSEETLNNLAVELRERPGVEVWHAHAVDFVDVDFVASTTAYIVSEREEETKAVFVNLNLWESGDDFIHQGEADSVSSAVVWAVQKQVREMAEVFLSDESMKTLTVAAYRSKGLTQEEAETAAALEWLV